MPRLILVSCRLPVTVRVKDGEARVDRSPGGLATGLRGPHERSGGLWIGWPGDLGGLSEEQRADVRGKLDAMRVIPIELNEAEISGFVEGFSNRVLWPLFHYLLDQIPLDSHDWDTYLSVSQRFANAVAERYQPGDLIWIHDYQLFLVPGLIREILPNAQIGFFLHIPFPASEVYRLMPWREAILRGLLGADLIGFHTLTYLRHFTSAVLRILGVEADIDRISYGGRVVRLGSFPMGVDAEAIEATVEGRARPQPSIAPISATETPLPIPIFASPTPAPLPPILSKRPGEHILLGIDRLDYTKGIPRRLLAVERVLKDAPELRGKLRLIQVAVPSRTQIPTYEEFRRRVDEMVGRINGLYSTVDGVPIHYLYRSFSEQDIIAMYRAADVMLVTPLRDGMNLVAKEFIAARTDDDGVLILSEFAGAASELGEALIVNPYDVEGTAAAIRQALAMPQEDRAARMRALRDRVKTYNVHAWAQGFIEALTPDDDDLLDSEGRVTLMPVSTVEVSRAAKNADRLLFLLDYDGTLMPFSNAPNLARPDPELLAILGGLAARKDTRVHVVSGRSREPLGSWLGGMPIGIHAEHGFWSREKATDPWTPLFDLPTEWKVKVLPVIQQFAAKTPGSRIEEKSTSIAWHYRMSDPEYGAAQAKELRFHLSNLMSNAPVQVLRGDKVVEVRLFGINKGLIPKHLHAGEDPSELVIAMGDDHTDEDMFAAMPKSGITIHVGQLTSAATHRLADWRAARGFLRSLIE